LRSRTSRRSRLLAASDLPLSMVSKLAFHGMILSWAMSHVIVQSQLGQGVNSAIQPITRLSLSLPDSCPVRIIHSQSARSSLPSVIVIVLFSIV